MAQPLSTLPRVHFSVTPRGSCVAAIVFSRSRNIFSDSQLPRGIPSNFLVTSGCTTSKTITDKLIPLSKTFLPKNEIVSLWLNPSKSNKVKNLGLSKVKVLESKPPNHTFVTSQSSKKSESLKKKISARPSNHNIFSYLPLLRGFGDALISSESGVKASSSAKSMADNAVPSPCQPILLLDVMGTLVRDPFYDDIPRFFGLTMSDLLKQKHPTAWVDFETGHLSEAELVAKFFADGREFDHNGLKQCMKDGYLYLDGVEDLLRRLRDGGYSLHAFTNYPSWYQMIEDKLQLSQYLPWTFVSCHIGKRKPDSQMYIEAAKSLNVQPEDCIFVDDREVNVKAASDVGMKGLVFKNAQQLEEDLKRHGFLI